MDSTVDWNVAERLLESVEDSCAVDPEVFLETCVRLEVWDDWGGIDVFDAMLDAFEFGAISATFRFFDVSHALRDDTLAEFMCTNDDGDTVVPNAMFWAAATASMDPETHVIDRREWAEAIMRIVAETGATRLVDDEA